MRPLLALVAAAGLLLAGFALGRATAHAATATPGTVTLENPGLHFGDTAVVDYHLEHRYREMKGGLLCWQGPVAQFADYNLVEETFWLNPKLFDGTFSLPVANGPDNQSRVGLDYSLPADCMTYVFREYWGRQSGMILTNVLTWEVKP